MTNRERVIETLKFKQTDRLPYNVNLTQQMHQKMMNNPRGKECWEKINNHISERDFNKRQQEISNRAGYFKDEFGVIWNKNGADKDIGVIESKIISSPDDFLKYEFPEIDEKELRDKCEEVINNKNNNFSSVSIGFSLFERAWTLCGMEDILCYMVTDPDFVHELLQKITNYNLKKIDIALQYKELDGIQFGDDWGQQKGLIMGETYWREFIKPYLKQMYSRAKETGKYIAQHSCGDIREILDDVIELGLNVYQTFQPEIYDLKEYKKILDKRLTVWGGISTQMDLPTKSPEEIRKITEETVEVFWNNGGYIGAPTHAVPFDVPVENLVAMIDVFEKA